MSYVIIMSRRIDLLTEPGTFENSHRPVHTAPIQLSAFVGGKQVDFLTEDLTITTFFEMVEQTGKQNDISRGS